jgi:hypothetical protein
LEASPNIFDRVMEFKLKDSSIPEANAVHLLGALGNSFVPPELAISDIGMVTSGVPRLALREYAVLRPDFNGRSPSCFLSQRSNLLLATDDGRLMMLPWRDPHLAIAKECSLEGLLRNQVTDGSIPGPGRKFDTTGQPGAYVSKMVYDESMGVMAWVLSDGSIYLVEIGQDSWTLLDSTTDVVSSLYSQTANNLDCSDWRLLRIGLEDSLDLEPSKCSVGVSLNPEFKLLAIGTELGFIYVYRIEDTVPKNTRFLHRFPYDLLRETSSTNVPDPKIILDLAWSEDCNALAVSHVGRLRLWSVFGHLLADIPASLITPV